MEENIGSRINVNRTKEAVATGADQIAVGCPFCRVMLSDGLTAEQADGNAREEVEVLDVAQMLLASVKGESATKARKAASNGAPAAAAATAAPAEAKGDEATKDEPEPGDATQTEETVTETAEVGPAAKAVRRLFPLRRGGGRADQAPTEPEAAEEKAEQAGGSLFDIGGDADEPTSEKADPTPEAEAVETPEDKPEPQTAVSSGGSLFDIEAPEEPAEKPAESEESSSADAGPVAEETKPAAETASSATPSSEIPEGGSLFDIEAPEEPAPAAAVAQPETEQPRDRAARGRGGARAGAREGDQRTRSAPAQP